jgi:hypothetical protein
MLGSQDPTGPAAASRRPDKTGLQFPQLLLRCRRLHTAHQRAPGDPDLKLPLKGDGPPPRRWSRGRPRRPLRPGPDGWWPFPDCSGRRCAGSPGRIAVGKSIVDPTVHPGRPPGTSHIPSMRRTGSGPAGRESLRRSAKMYSWLARQCRRYPMLNRSGTAPALWHNRPLPEGSGRVGEAELVVGVARKRQAERRPPQP